MEATEDGFADEKMADVELDDLRHPRQSGDGVEGQAVTGVDFEPGSSRLARRGGEALDLSGCTRRVVVESAVAVGACVQLDDIGLRAPRRPRSRADPAR